MLRAPDVGDRTMGTILTAAPRLTTGCNAAPLTVLVRGLADLAEGGDRPAPEGKPVAVLPDPPYGAVAAPGPRGLGTSFRA
jgi:hypothetical protein